MTLDSKQSDDAKRAGMELAAANAGDDFWCEVMNEFTGWIEARRAIGQTEIVIEEFRAVCRHQPSSHKAWGPLPTKAMRLGLILPAVHADGSPRMRRSASVRTHSHPVRVWEIA